jgi:guanylate kinase
MLEIRKKIKCNVLCVMPPSWQVLRSRLEERKENSPEEIENRMKENARQVNRMLMLKNLSGIFFTTNYQYQLTLYGIEKWLKSNFDFFNKSN